MQKFNKKIDFVVIVLLVVFATFTTVVARPNLLIATLLFFGLPSLYLIFRNIGIVKKSFIFAFLFSIPLSLFVDTLAAIDGAWIVPCTVFPFKFFGVATVEVYIYGLLWVLMLVLFYEHFFDKGKKGDRISRNIRYLLYLFSVLLFFVVIFFFVNPSLLKIPYAYLWISLVFVSVPLFIFLYFYPKFVKRYLVVALFFFFVMLFFELAALETELWLFPGTNFIGFVEMFKYRFPLEEFIFWMVLASPSMLAYYEFFADDRK